MRIVSIVFLLVVSVFVAGCQSSQSNNTSGSSNAQPGIEDKVGTTTKTGVISQAGETFFLQESGKQPEPVESYSVDLSQYVGKTVTVSGQFSGNTLFVGSIE